MLLSTCVNKSGLLSVIRQQISLGPKRNAVVSCVPVIKSITNSSSSLFSLNTMRSFNTTKMNLHEEKAHDQARLWVIEKATSAVLVPLIPFGLLIPNRLFDSLLAILITAHTFWGMEAIMVEYVRVILFGPTIPKVAIGFVYAMTVFMLGGLFYLIFNDIGLCRGFWRVWRNMRKPRDTAKRR